ncbi:hypothetical protein RSOLAG1IB_09046 [Rhizoctonia solani AG-1 IB]|uniref:Uncharacterized protein n=1 Tax=Thanatephorus cucumeris (strain AG1-IB / isolate 7/3/14) TaxID=1108050 RepID=A0A0B7FQ80_THACB|nr:hypothetical protein RSOLAG1IB_09046 [Rhizoctonia solani AG-1 IB]
MTFDFCHTPTWRSRTPDALQGSLVELGCGLIYDPHALGRTATHKILLVLSRNMISIGEDCARLALAPLGRLRYEIGFRAQLPASLNRLREGTIQDVL